MCSYVEEAEVQEDADVMDADIADEVRICKFHVPFPICTYSSQLSFSFLVSAKCQNRIFQSHSLCFGQNEGYADDGPALDQSKCNNLHSGMPTQHGMHHFRVHQPEYALALPIDCKRQNTGVDQPRSRNCNLRVPVGQLSQGRRVGLNQ